MILAHVMHLVLIITLLSLSAIVDEQLAIPWTIFTIIAGEILYRLLWYVV